MSSEQLAQDQVQALQASVDSEDRLAVFEAARSIIRCCFEPDSAVPRFLYDDVEEELFLVWRKASQYLEVSLRQGRFVLISNGVIRARGSFLHFPYEELTYYIQEFTD
jgi:hypothetical protein